jgi:flagellin FlaB
MRRHDSAFSGLEAAIVIIAFVVVAAFFGLSVLSSGFIATEEAKGTTVSGYKMASSTLYIEGGVYATLDSSSQALDKVWFSAGIPDTGQAQDLSKMMIVYTHSKDSNTFREYTYGPNATATTFGVEGGPVMMPGDKRVFTLAEVNGPIPGGWFTIEVKPQMGAPTFVTYHLPDSFAGGSVLT